MSLFCDEGGGVVKKSSCITGRYLWRKKVGQHLISISSFNNRICNWIFHTCVWCHSFFFFFQFPLGKLVKPAAWYQNFGNTNILLCKIHDNYLTFRLQSNTYSHRLKNIHSHSKITYWISWHYPFDNDSDNDNNFIDPDEGNCFYRQQLREK